VSVESVREFFTTRNLPDPITIISESGATVDLAAKILGVNPELIAKTLAFRLKDKDILIVTSGNKKIDNRKYRDYFKTKAKMLNHEEVFEITGHPVGGVCPFGLKTNIDIYIDMSLKDFDYVYPAAGSAYSIMKISPGEMQKLTNASWANICV